MKPQMPMIIADDDAPVRDVLMARAKEKHDRTAVIDKLINSGRVRVMQDDDPVNVRLRIGEHYFSCLRSEFPSTVLLANLQLALRAGVGDDETTQTPPYHTGRIENYHANNAMAYGVVGRKWCTKDYLEETYPYPVGGDLYKAVAEQVTATVTKKPNWIWRAAKALRKGLRP